MEEAENIRGPLCWATKEIRPDAKWLILGSFTSLGGLSDYYYCSSRNDFYYCLDYALFLNEDDIDLSKSARAIKEQILKSEKSVFSKLKRQLVDAPENQKQVLRNKIHSKLNKLGFDICDIFCQVSMKSSTSSKDSDIMLKSSATKVAEESLRFASESGIQLIFCTSGYVQERLNIVRRGMPIELPRSVSLLSPSGGLRIKLAEKLRKWKEVIASVR